MHPDSFSPQTVLCSSYLLFINMISIINVRLSIINYQQSIVYLIINKVITLILSLLHFFRLEQVKNKRYSHNCPLKWEHDLFQNNEAKEQEEMTVMDNEDDNMKQRQLDGRWMHGMEERGSYCNKMM